MYKFVETIRGRFISSPIRRFYKLRAAHSIMTELLSALDFEDCLRILVNRIASYLDIEKVSIMLVDSDKKRLVVKIAKGPGAESMHNANIRLGEGIAGWVGKTGEPLLIKDITKDSRFVRRPGGKYYNNSLLSVPLKLRNRIIGVINVNNKISKDVFRLSDLDLLRTIADFAAVAAELIRLEGQVSETNKYSQELISNVTHELKTPLATIKEALSLIADGLSGPLNEKQKRYIGMSIQNADRMARMLDNILLSEEFVQNRQKISRNLFNVTDTAKNIMDSMGMLAKKKGIMLGGAIPGKKIEIWGDPDKLNEVISNLVENAIKYNRPDGRVDVMLEDSDRSVTISVRDTGVGIAKNDIGKIFDKYYRVNNSEKKDITGIGLGLSIVKDIVDMHKGKISVESECDKGTKFTVTLPKDLRSVR